MIFTILGKQIDIHTGGVEHIPVHHNNEIAQAEAATGKQFSKFWLHRDHITIDGKKISKSLGNTIYVHSIIDRGINPLALRYWFLTAHYRTQANFTWDALTAAETALKRLSRLYWEMPDGGKPHEEFLHEFYTELSEDLNTPSALALVWSLVKDEKITLADRKATLTVIDGIFGLGFSENQPTHKLKVVSVTELEPVVREVAQKREQARKEKDYAKSDDLRKQLEAFGYSVKDTPEGQELYKD